MACASVLSNEDNLGEFKKLLYVASPQTKGDFLDVLRILLTDSYHTHIYLDLKA